VIRAGLRDFMGVNLGFRLRKSRGIEIRPSVRVCVWIWTGPSCIGFVLGTMLIRLDLRG
jgi:hypothetical protein